MSAFSQYLLGGISLGSVYAIIALGYTMVYGIAKMLNFAHGDIIMVGAYVSFSATTYLGAPGWVSYLMAIALCAVLGMLIEGLAYRPLRHAAPLAVLITAIGVSYFLQNSAQLIWGAAPKHFTSLASVPVLTHLTGLPISEVSLITVFTCVAIMIGLMWFISRTRTGKAMRACSQDAQAAQLMGINVNRTISTTFAIGSALAAIAGVLLCSYSPVLQPTTGSMPGIKAFTAAVFGGIGSLPGAFIGGILLGVVEALAKAYLSSSLANSIVFGVLIIVLLVRPAGLLGRRVPEKV
ncbi:amino acid/amide ABC transporter membrane protein 1, HAAT family [Coriobacterium glomerans PW2]|uniref:Amino acid/amide ABC transporter membrane protein 1, HAAT family n=1 Tax=Coriobacterium glomerans (strain ATCC 49209 / DSM 20642 / JCM 10262 / PW2) TaxID=700015 RepID=F2NBI2_CORGP|nr:branched-chain amino acid ABC transporter permease [Coriobacterium glomerans]AEB06718.1 amino acid/amide ABC transporter membrane protein 1, HAAT family [Coriobacterium glomerans PW2]